MSQKSITLRFGDEIRKQHAIQTGEILPETQQYLLELKDFSPEERALILQVDGAWVNADRIPQTREDWMALIQAHLEAKRQEANQEVQKYLEMDEEWLAKEALYRLSYNRPDTDPAKIFRVKRADEALLAALRERWSRAVQRALELQAEEERKKEAERKAREAQERAQKEREKAQRQAREEWILAHGSERLKKGHQMGYSCTGLFEKEFAAFYFPDAECDWHEEARWKERRCPSLEALRRVEEYAQRFPEWGFEIVWLTSPPRPFGMNEEDYGARESQFEPCEAIAIKIPGFSSPVVEEV